MSRGVLRRVMGNRTGRRNRDIRIKRGQNTGDRNRSTRTHSTCKTPNGEIPSQVKFRNGYSRGESNRKDVERYSAKTLPRVQRSIRKKHIRPTTTKKSMGSRDRTDSGIKNGRLQDIPVKSQRTKTIGRIPSGTIRNRKDKTKQVTYGVTFLLR